MAKHRHEDFVPKTFVCSSKREAIMAMESGFNYFLEHDFKKTVLVVVVLLGFAGYVLHDYIDSMAKKADVTLAKPMSSNEGFSIMPNAIAASVKADTIWIKGKAWGIKDPNFDVWKLNEMPILLVHDKQAERVYRIVSSEFNSDRLKSAK